jgi:hypothetical protein
MHVGWAMRIRILNGSVHTYTIGIESADWKARVNGAINYGRLNWTGTGLLAGLDWYKSFLCSASLQPNLSKATMGPDVTGIICVSPLAVTAVQFTSPVHQFSPVATTPNYLPPLT